jgi:hypothetical protein
MSRTFATKMMILWIAALQFPACSGNRVYPEVGKAGAELEGVDSKVRDPLPVCADQLVAQACESIARSPGSTGFTASELANSMSINLHAGLTFLHDIGFSGASTAPPSVITCQDLCRKLVAQLPPASRPPASDIGGVASGGKILWVVDLSPESLTGIDVDEDADLKDGDVDYEMEEIDNQEKEHRSITTTEEIDKLKTDYEVSLTTEDIIFELLNTFRVYPKKLDAQAGSVMLDMTLYKKGESKKCLRDDATPAGFDAATEKYLEIGKAWVAKAITALNGVHTPTGYETWMGTNMNGQLLQTLRKTRTALDHVKMRYDSKTEAFGFVTTWTRNKGSPISVHKANLIQSNYRVGDKVQMKETTKSIICDGK